MDDFGPVRELTEEEIQNDSFFKSYKKKAEVVKIEKAKKKKLAQQNFIKTFRLYGGEDIEPSDSEDEVKEISMEIQTADNQKLRGDAAPLQDTESGYETYSKNGSDEHIQELEQPGFTVSAHDVSLIKKTVKKQLISNFNATTSKEQFQELCSIMESTVHDHEGNSTLLIGPRGSGKTTLINKCLNRMTEKYTDSFVTIRLNSFVHSDEVSAVREIGLQFTKIFKDRNIEGTLEARQFATAFTNILNFLDTSEETDKSNIPIIFVIDNLEAFTKGNKQILLYNLFEFTQTGKSPICIVGTSTKFTTRELLEKRVRSRFSQRLIIMNKFKKFEDFTANCINNVTISPSTLELLEDKNYGHKWNQYFHGLLEQPSVFKKNLLHNFNTSRDFRTFNNSMFLPISKVSSLQPFPRDDDFKAQYQNQMKSYVEEVLKSLSTLELLLVIACARFLAKSNLVSVNFSIAYREYVDMMKQFNVDKSTYKSSAQSNYNMLTNLKVNYKIWDAAALKNCWISVYKMGLLIEYVPNLTDGGINAASSNKYLTMEDTRMLQLDVSLNELNRFLKDNRVFKQLTKL